MHGFFAFALSALVGCSKAPQPLPAGTARNAVLIVVDTLRADAVSQVETPNIAGLAAEGSAAELAWSPATWTAPAVVSLFTGMSVRQHGWDFPFPRYMARRTDSYPDLPATPLLAEVLRDAGFETTALYGNPLLGQRLGFSRGFDRFDFVRDEGMADSVTDLVRGWEDGGRHFLYLHLLGVHQPLQPSHRSAKRWGLAVDDLPRDGRIGIGYPRRGKRVRQDQYVEAYHAVVEDTDGRLGRILDALEPVRDDTAIVLTADHGELLGEHGLWGHDHYVWEQLTEVPFIVEGVPITLPARVSTASVPDLVCRALGVKHAWPTRLDDGGPLVSQREGKLALTVDGRFKGIWKAGGSESDLTVYDLAADPEEQRPVALHRDDLIAARTAWEQLVPAGHLPPAAHARPESMQAVLEQLGYIDADDDDQDAVAEGREGSAEQ